ncbi:MAG: hypothetical protein AB7T31_12210 [Gemmatimonadales bacterium]
MSPRLISRATALVAVLALAAPVRAQVSVGTGIDYMGYAFDPGLGADAAQLFMVPVAVQFPLMPGLGVDIYGAWAEGRVERGDTLYKLSGPIDTGVRAAYQATPWALVTLGANVPTGNASHDGQEAIVASLMSTEILGFRESSWGRGFAVTGSVAVARSMGNFGLGLAGAYSVRGKFNPTADDASLEYQPGSEARIRLGIDRNFGNSTLTLGATFINYAEDQANGQNLFQAGKRFRFDASYAFRMAAGVWTLYAADLMRQNGTLQLPNVDTSGTPLGTFTSIDTPKQNLAVAGFMGAVALGGGFVFRPHVDLKLQSREDSGGSDAGSGWLVAAGGDVPMRIFGGHDFFPKARILLGSLKDPAGDGVRVFGMEFKGTVVADF